ncbi:MAG: T9SS type A sorting domain-containing protein, partial [Candidatus Marinimicrobia bacterium]|nr:T9SS type A sorting domain-containing protein [Candidatus Neomarinimicrobiota bacterium]
LGSFRPTEALSGFDSEEMKGEWTLYIYNHSSGGSTVSKWSLIIESDNSTPKDPPTTSGTEYKGSSFSVSGQQVTRGTLTISDTGTITDINVKMSGSSYISSLDISLISPYGTAVKLVQQGAINGNAYDDMVLDDEASKAIADGSVPYLGSFRPTEALSGFDSEEMKGEWTLYIYNHSSGGSTVSKWSLIIDFITGAPKATISSTETSPTSKSAIPVKVQFDRDVTGFVSSEVTLGNASISDFTGSGSDYTFDAKPSADGNVTVDIASGVAKDSDNIDNIKAEQFSIISDRTNPIEGTVNDGTGDDIDIQNTSSTLNTNWTGFSDALSGIASYDWAIGTSSGGTEILDWTNAGNTTSANKSNLSLINDQTYYISVRAIDKAGNTSAVATSDGVKADFSSPSAPTDFVATSNDGSITLQWTKNTELDIASYKIYRSTESGFSLSNDSLIYSASATETEYVDQQVVYGVTQYYKMTATDLAGNEGTASSEVNGRSIDTTPPTVSISAPENGNSFGTDDQVTISWQASDNWQLSWAKSYYRYSSNDQFVFIDSTDATVGQHNWQVPDSTISTTCDILVIVSDIESNTTQDTMSGVFTITDNTSPMIFISKPTSDSSVKEYNYIDVGWTSTDNIAMDSIKVYHSSSQNGNYSLQKSISSDNTNTSYAVPLGASNQASVKLVAIDKSGNTNQAISEYFTVIDNTPPTVSISSPSQNDQFEIGTTLAVSWTGADNVAVIRTDINYSTDGGTVWNETAKNLTGSETYQWLAPNFPTNNLIIQVIVYDAVGFSDTSTVNNVGIYPVYPKIVTIDPKPGTLRWLHEDISVTFSRAMDTTTITTQNVVVTSQYSSQPELLYNSSNKELIIRNSSGYVSLDTINIKLNGSGLMSTFGYQMDGDEDGTAGGDSSLQYNSLMLADFDTSNTIDVSDLAIMITALETKNYYYDIGPVLNTVPHFLAQPDSKFDIEDIMTFAMMWNWFSASNPSSVNDLITLGNPLNIEFDHKSIAIEFPDGAIAGQVQILGLNGRLEYGINKDDKYLGLDYFNEETQFFTYIMERNEEGIIEIPIKIKGTSTDMDMSYKFVDQDGNVISQATQSIKIENIPEQFNLHQNYPNPFNPITTINYDLPQQAYVNLMIYDILGREVVKLVSEEMPAGYKTIIWDSRNNYGESVSAGIYFYQIQTKDFVKTKKMVLLK